MGLTFKDMANEDIGKVFFNNEEFSAYHTVDGKQMHVTIDGNELIERQQATGWNPRSNVMRSDGLYAAQLLIYVPAADYGPKPKPGKPLLLDGKRQYIITDCVDEDGIYSITLEANRA